MRDPTRGGLAATLVEIATRRGLGVEVDESAIPVRDAVRGACELLGLDPLLVANEGKLVAFVPEADADRALAALARPPARARRRSHRYVTRGPPRRSWSVRHAGRRPARSSICRFAEPLPRIC